MADAEATAGTSRATSVRFLVLGPLRVARAGVEVPLGGPQQRAVLARLLLESAGPVSVERLADALWGERVPAGSVTTIQTYISHLREAVEPGRPRGRPPTILIRQNGGYCLRTDDSAVDADEFVRREACGRALLQSGDPLHAAAELSAALSLWRGPVLQDLAAYDFVAEAAGRLDIVRAGALEAWIDAELALGHHQDLAVEVDQLVAEFPLRERLHEQRILIAYRCGRQAAALSAYTEVRLLLADELGIDPGPGLQHLHQAVLRQDPALDWRPVSRSTPLFAATRSSRLTSTDQDAIAPAIRLTHGRRWLPVGARFVAIAVLVAVSATSSRVAGGHIPSGLRILSANSVGRIDAQGILRAAVHVGPGPSAVVAADGSVWAVNEGAGSLSRVDPRDGRVLQTIPVGSAPGAVAATGDSVWVTNGGDGTVSRVNVNSDKLVDTIRVGNLPSAITATPDSVWVANFGDDTVQRIDPATDRTDAPVGVGGQPAGLAARDGTVWVTNSQDGTVSRVDAATHLVQSPVPVGAGPEGIAVTDEAVWVANSSELTVSRLDPDSGRQVDVIAVGDGPNAVVQVGGVLWVSNEYDGTLTAIDPRTDVVRRQIALGSSPTGLAALGSSLWVAASGSIGAAHRGGTLTVEGAPIPGFDTIDPAMAWLPEAFALPYDGLVALRRTGGARGITLVPDLATALPTPTNGGRQYSFTVRRGIRYSNGEDLQATDLKRGLIRALRAHSSYYYGIVGARGCAADPRQCDLKDGVVVDNLRSRITFNLLAPDPDFLAKLAVHVVAIPSSVGPGEVDTPVPATGPYMLSGFTTAHRRELLTLTRNPYFREWSHAAKPDGYPDVIRWLRVRDEARRAADLTTGRADLSDPYLGIFSPAETNRLDLAHPELVHSEPLMATQYVWLNTRTPPFDDVRVRQALNYAVDRNRIVTRAGGSTRLSVSCQIRPQNYVGFTRYCPYTSAPSADGVYRGPDLDAARRLVQAAGTRGERVVVWGTGDAGETDVDRYLVQVLATLGFRATMKVMAPDRTWDEHMQVGMSWWGADFPAQSNFWEPLLSCASSRDSVDQTTNHGGFCSPAIDALAHQALATQATDPALARQRWAEVGRRLTDEAPWIAGPVTRSYAVTSSRVGNYQTNPVLGPLIDQMWVR